MVSDTNPTPYTNVRRLENYELAYSILKLSQYYLISAVIIFCNVLLEIKLKY